MNHQQLLATAGLNHYESKIYLHLLTHGELAASKVSQALSIPRSTTRGVLDNFCEQGVIRKMYRKNTQYYQALSPKKLLTHLERQQADLSHRQQIVSTGLESLQYLYQSPKSLPKVQFFQGASEVIAAFNSSLFEAGLEEILIFTSYRFFEHKAIKKNDDEYYVKMRVKKKIGARVLVGESKESKNLTLVSKKELRERRFLPSAYQLPGNLYIYGDKVLHFSFDEKPPTAVITTSQMMADTMRSVFEFMWERSETQGI